MNEVAEIEKEENIPLTTLKKRLGEIDFSPEAISAEFKEIEGAGKEQLKQLCDKYQGWSDLVWRAERVIYSLQNSVRIQAQKNEILK